MHSSAHSKVVVWCDGIDDRIDDSGCAAVENKKTVEVSPVSVCVLAHVSEDSPTSRGVHQACERCDALREARLRPRPCSARRSARNDSPTPH
jgi:hypothetical protein